jgi:hypothetical protein
MKFGPEVEGEMVEWIDVPADAVDGDNKVDLERAFEASPDHCTAHAVSHVWTPEAGDDLFQMHVDDLFSLTVNGKEAIAKRVGSDEGVKVSLAKGWNRLMLKVSDHEGGWTLNPKAKNSLKAEYAIGLAFAKE